MSLKRIKEVSEIWEDIKANISLKKVYKTANLSRDEHFTITEIGKLNAYIKIYDCSGFLQNKVIPLTEFKNWIKDV